MLFSHFYLRLKASQAQEKMEEWPFAEKYEKNSFTEVVRQTSASRTE
jgi:hypothetical protein